MNKVCYVVGAGDCYWDKLPMQEGDYLIAVDGGYDTVVKMGYTPDLVIGDFDSVEKKPDFMNQIALSPIKDDTDMLAGVREGKKRGYSVFSIYGGTGGRRISHTLANLQLLLTEPKVRCFLFDREEVIFSIRDETVVFHRECSGYLSVFSASEQCTVTEENLKYQIKEYPLTYHMPLGVSNEFLGEEAKVTAKDGCLFLVMHQDNLSKFHFETRKV